MTLQSLKKIVDIEVARGNGRAKVCVDKSSLRDGNGTFAICDVSSASTEFVPLVDGDGSHESLADGTERTRRCFVLTNEHFTRKDGGK